MNYKFSIWRHPFSLKYQYATASENRTVLLPTVIRLTCPARNWYLALGAFRTVILPGKKPESQLKGAARHAQVVEDSLVAVFRWRYNQGSRMSAPPPNPGRASPENGPPSGPKKPYLSDGDEIPGEIDERAQPDSEDGVMEDMATLAINPRLLANLEAAETHHAASDFGEMDDATIMLELRTGNMAGFDYLIQKYRKPIIHFMYRMVRNQAVAEELAQEVFLRVYRSRETYRAEARFSTWLYRIATNLGVNYARDTRHERAASTVYLDEVDSETGTTPDVADATPDVEANLLRQERLNAIREHVMALPERQRMAVLMHKYDGMDYKQIGDVLKLSESATKSLLFRAYQTLRDKLKGFL
ncbi:MAG: polymerase, sigma-24 subunit, subfamily [Edaphobacter sp.]|nr:polymerase, sigma-24 subunit, subfamily [Edaphobacter sp.]